MALTITLLSDTIGAEVVGANLSQSAPAGDVAAIRQALIDHLVIVIRDQSLDPEQLLAALRLFGDTMEQHLTDTLMEAHPEIAVLDSRAMPPDKEGPLCPVALRDCRAPRSPDVLPSACRSDAAPSYRQTSAAPRVVVPDREIDPG